LYSGIPASAANIVEADVGGLRRSECRLLQLGFHHAVSHQNL